MIKHKNEKEILKEKKDNQIIKDKINNQDCVFNNDSSLFTAPTYTMEDASLMFESQDHVLNKIIYVYDDQEVDCHEEEIIFSCDNDDDDGFDWHEAKVLIDGIFNNIEIWNLPFLEHIYDINICLNMPKTHEAFQQAILELSKPQSKEPHETSEDHYKLNENLIENKSSSSDYTDFSGMGRNKEDGRFVLLGRNSMGREESDLRLVFPMDICEILIKISSSVIHFASTARFLFAVRVSHHDNYIHDYNQDSI
jgi:hypothetical protein